MTRTTRRLALLAAAALAVTALHQPASAATKPLLSDPSGDAKLLGAGFDIVSADLRTTGTTKKVGKKTVYTPTYLVASLTLAGPPSQQLGSTFTLNASTSACHNGTFAWSYAPGSVLGDSPLYVTGCGTTNPGSSEPSEFVAGCYLSIAGNTITWKLKLTELGRDLPLKSTFFDVVAQSNVDEPVFNLFGTNLLEPDSSIDYAETAAVYTLG